MRTIAVFLENRPFFGALLVHLPLLRTLRERAPDARIVLFAPFPQASMLVEAGAADALVTYTGRFGPVRRLLRAQSPDEVLVLRPASQWLDLAVATSGARATAGFDSWLSRRVLRRTAPHDTAIYRARKYLTLAMPRAEALAADLSAHFRDAVARAGAAPPAWAGARTLAVLPGGGAGDFKRWGAGRFLALCERLAADDPGLRFAWILGPQEADVRERLDASPLAARTRVLFDRPVPELAAAAFAATAAVGNDCGPGHVFQMCGCPFACVISDHDGEGAIRADEWLDAANRALATIGAPGGAIGTIPVAGVLERTQRALALRG